MPVTGTKFCDECQRYVSRKNWSRHRRPCIKEQVKRTYDEAFDKEDNHIDDYDGKCPWCTWGTTVCSQQEPGCSTDNQSDNGEQNSTTGSTAQEPTETVERANV